MKATKTCMKTFKGCAIGDRRIAVKVNQEQDRDPKRRLVAKRLRQHAEAGYLETQADQDGWIWYCLTERGWAWISVNFGQPYAHKGPANRPLTLPTL